ncbi:MAG: hypothetical protein AAF517_20885, partial [Planctomycetota bacterium]
MEELVAEFEKECVVLRPFEIGVRPRHRAILAGSVRERNLFEDPVASIEAVPVVLRCGEDHAAVVDESWIDVDRTVDAAGFGLSCGDRVLDLDAPIAFSRTASAPSSVGA